MAPADLGLGALFGLGPLETRLCPPAQLTVANVPGWEPGTLVEFLLHGSDISEEWAPYGGWAPVSTGFVSDDGSTIATESGRGLPVLGLIGVRIAE